MKIMTFQIILFSLMVIFRVSTTAADVIELKNGSRIIGTIEKFDARTVRIKTDFAGILQIDLNNTVRFSSDTPLYVSFADHKRILGKVTWTKSQIRIEKPEGEIIHSQEKPEAGWQETMPDPFIRRWSYEIGFDLAGKTGNTEKIGMGGKAQAKFEGLADRTMFYLKYTYAKEEGVNSDNLIVGGGDFEKYFAGRHSLYTRAELEHDKIKGLDFGASVALGYGYYFLKKKHHTFRGRTGLLYSYESWIDDQTNDTARMDFGLAHMYEFNSYFKLLNELVYTPSIEDYRDYRIYHESSLSIPLAWSDIWKVQLGVSNDYISRPPKNKEYLDTTYFTRLVLNWQ